MPRRYSQNTTLAPIPSNSTVGLMKRREFLKSTAVSAVVMILSGGLESTARAVQSGTRRPNFIVILADDMGYGEPSCYGFGNEPGTFGHQRFATPNLDKMASEGMTFTDFHVCSPVCTPSRAGLLTGRYPQRSGLIEHIPTIHGTPRSNWGIQRREITLPELLQRSGYKTAMFGKWHLGHLPKHNPVNHGFDEFRGFLNGFNDFNNRIGIDGKLDWYHGAELFREDGYTTHLITKHAVKFLKENGNDPFFLYVAHPAPHFPFQGPDDAPFFEEGKRGPNRDLWESTTGNRARKTMVAELDKGVGRIIETVKQLDLAEDTFVFFFSDNGADEWGWNGPLNGYKKLTTKSGNGVMGKATMWDGGTRVPAIALWPGKIKAGAVSDQLAINLDLLPTILELANVKPPADHKLDGVSIKRVLLGNEAETTRTLYWDFERFIGLSPKGQQAMRRGPWKLSVNALGHDGIGLYNLDEDIAERNNLVDQYPDRAEKMFAELEVWRNEVNIGASSQPQTGP